MRKMTHQEIFLESMISVIPIAIAIEWENISKKVFDRKPKVFERYIILFFGSVITLYIFGYFLQIRN